ncbi:hypothetical protein F0562_011938 [Nyssa sinensis]|uniref:AAA+ ATPase domain-containing protein n=1 Tax=Nyssa sinensis TaxID=561372 RepID=A0A5J4ZRA9_9ASTE|nr:hypothetical protein F0562_011938 [Nyssa sinensis]
MAESAVTFLLNQLTRFLNEEVKLLRGIREEFENIRDELERMRAFLRVADAKEDSDPELQVWVKQVRDVAFDTEDVLDEFMLRLAHHPADGFYGFLRKICFSIKNLKARRRIASEIRRIQSRFPKISEGHLRYRYQFNISDQGSTSTTVANNPCYDHRRRDALLLEEAEVVGIDRHKKQLINWLVEDNPRFKVISVVGMGGSGKTTLVKKVYEDVQVKGHFQNHAWITVSQSFKIEELLKNLIRQLFEEIKQPLPQRVEAMDITELTIQIKEFLQQSRYVIVLDDVWSRQVWHSLKLALPDNNCGSRVLLTTRIVDIASTASTVASHGNIYPIEALTVEESWTLFCRKTFQDNSCPDHLKKLSRSILEKCEGLPLAIVAISGVLATKDTSGIQEWEMVQQSLGAELEGNNELESMKRILFLSYNDLPDHYLKICFLYLIIFPEDHMIECMRLIRLWIAEGFIEVRERRTLEEVAEGYLNDLVNRNLIQVAKRTTDGRVRMCRIHDVIREIFVSKSKEQNIIAITIGSNTKWPETVRRLSIHNTLGNVQQSKSFSQLRSLLMFEVMDPLSKSSLPMLFNGCLRLLKVLDLRGTSLETIPNEVVKLFHLRYLSLRGTKVKMLPKSIGNLQKLETLDLKDTYVTELPIEIQKLQKLRHLLVYRYNMSETYLSFHNTQGFKVSAKIGALLSLQKLCYIEANHFKGGFNMVEELGRLTQLRRLGIEKLTRENGMALCSSIAKLRNLQSLCITSTEEDEIIDLKSLSSAPQFLRRLYLQGRLEQFPCWISSLHSLDKVFLMWSQLRYDEPLQSLQDLPNLSELRLKQAYDGEELCFKAGGFQRLKELWLITLKGLRWVTMEKGTMPCLEEIYIWDCKLMEQVPLGIEHLTNLEYLNLGDMSDKLLTRIDREIGVDYWKIGHIPRVWIDDTQSGPERVPRLSITTPWKMYNKAGPFLNFVLCSCSGCWAYVVQWFFEVAEGFRVEGYFFGDSSK